MKLSDDKIREIVLEAIDTLGEKATPDTVRKVVEEKLSSSIEINDSKKDLSSGRVILTSFGKNTTGIVSTISSCLSNNNCDILDISQKIMQEFFTMIMMIDISNSKKDFKEIQEELSKISEQIKVKIYLQHEDVFKYMHRI